ncbi:uncharacterized protein LOC131888580 [Tigriopus californicus]|uniref:uncharacterized protein LOC131888580 n=1 Tax=Tigriopus californicus TaxID=6832 RepID=UPI0027DA4C1A|nr:uncharacterized protein LOC131888580 [Tigriopus californicus]
MAKGYSFESHESAEGRVIPTRPARRSDSRRHGDKPEYTNFGYSSETTVRPISSTASTSYAGGHYAESPIVVPGGEEPRTLAIVPHQPRRPSSSQSRGRPPLGRTSSDGPMVAVGQHPPSSRYSYSRSQERPPRGPTNSTVSKVIRSRSLSSRPAGIVVRHPPHHQSKSTVDVYSPQALSTLSRPGTRMSSKSGKSGLNGNSNSTKAGVVIETMSAPNPFCPNTKGVCCLMLLVNLALILVAIGFIIVLQLPEPVIVWNLGVVILVFGFVTFLVALIYCSCICQEANYEQRRRGNSGELYWTHHWQKNITIPEIKTQEHRRWEEVDHFPEDDSDTSSRDYPRLYLESEYATEREADFETDREAGGKPPSGGKYTASSPRSKIYHERERD